MKQKKQILQFTFQSNASMVHVPAILPFVHLMQCCVRFWNSITKVLQCPISHQYLAVNKELLLTENIPESSADSVYHIFNPPDKLNYTATNLQNFCISAEF